MSLNSTSFGDIPYTIYGLTGGGTISANRTITLGTPTEVSTASTNSVTSTGHTHALSSAVKASLAKADNARPMDDGLFKTTVRIDTGDYTSLYLQSGTKNDVIIERTPHNSVTFINRSKSGDNAHTIILPLANKSGTVALTSDIPALSSSTKLGVEEETTGVKYSDGYEMGSAIAEAINRVPDNCVITGSRTNGSYAFVKYRRITRL